MSKTLVHPIDVVKKRFQVMSFDERAQFGFGRQASYTGTWHGLVTIVSQEGVRGLYKGLLPSLVKAVPSTLITFLFYDSMRAFLVKHEL